MLPGLDHERLVRFAARYVNRQDAEDVVQTAYLNILQRPAAAFRNEARYSTWAMSIVKHAAIDFYEHGAAEKRGRPLSLDSGYFDESELPIVESPHAAVALAEAIDRLSDENYRLVETYAQYGNVPEAARAAGLSRSVFQRRLAQAKAELKELL